jgi:hypothetical protein
MATAQEMRESLDRLYDSFGSGDPTVCTASAADDVIGIGSDPDECWEGRSQVVRVVAAQVEKMSTSGVYLQAGDLRIFAHGNVVWSVDRPVLHLGDGSEVPMRVTVIAVSEAGILRLKHFHYSVGAPNEDVFQQVLVTG